MPFAHVRFYFWSLDLSLLHSCLKYPAPISNWIWNLDSLQNLPAQPYKTWSLKFWRSFNFFVHAICKSLVASSINGQINQITRTVSTNQLFTTWRKSRGHRTVGMMFKLHHFWLLSNASGSASFEALLVSQEMVPATWWGFESKENCFEGDLKFSMHR